MSRKRIVLAGLVGILTVLALVMITGPVLAKKRPKPPPEPEPDPDAAIAYVVESRGKYSLWVMNDDGTNRTKILDVGSYRIFRPSWSPDGDQLVFSSNVNGLGVYVVDVDGDNLTKITSTQILCAPAWSPAEVPGAGDDVYRIAFNDRGDAGPDGTYNDTYLCDVDGDNRIRLIDTDDEMEGKMTWSPSGDRLAYSIADDVGDRWGMYDFGDDSNSVRRHGGAMQGYHVHWPDWARTDEDLIAWQVTIGTDRDIFVVDLDDPSNPVRLTTGGDLERYPSWSEDDSKIVFEQLTTGKKGKLSIRVMSSADGSGETLLVDGGKTPTFRRPTTP